MSLTSPIEATLAGTFQNFCVKYVHLWKSKLRIFLTRIIIMRFSKMARDHTSPFFQDRMHNETAFCKTYSVCLSTSSQPSQLGFFPLSYSPCFQMFSDLRYLQQLGVQVECGCYDCDVTSTQISDDSELKGAVSRQSSSFCLILPISRPQSLWNLK